MIKLRIFRFVAVTIGAAVLLFATFAPVRAVRARLFNNPEALHLTAGDSLAEGTWKLDLDAYQDARRNGLQIEIRKGPGSYWIHSISSDRSPRLDRDTRDGATIHFAIENDPGDLVFDGKVSKGTALGTYAFKPNKAFADEAGKLLKEDLSTSDLLDLSFSDVSLNYIRDIVGAGIDARLKTIMRLRNHGVKSAEAKEFAATGFKNADDIVHFRDHGVKPDLARDAKDLGFTNDAEGVVRMRDHGVDSAYLKGWKDAGIQLTSDEVVRVRDHGLKADYAAAWKKAGYNLTSEELIRARNFGVPADFAAALGAGGSRPTIDEAIRMRQYGVDAKYYRAIHDLDAKYTVEDIVKFRQYGVPVEFISGVNVAGRPAVDAQTIIDLRNRGVSAETARKLRQ